MRTSARFAMLLSLTASLWILPGCWTPFGDDDTPEPPRTSVSDSGEKKSWWQVWKSDPKPTGPRVRNDDGYPPSSYETGRADEEPSDFLRATELVKQHQFEQAKQLLANVTAQNPNHAEAYRWLGDCFYNLMELDDAVGAYSHARELDPTNYFALRGKGFSHLHLGHEHWRKYEDALRSQRRDIAETALSDAHDNYKRSLELLQQALRVFPGDNEAMYGRAMAAEGASRKLYANAVGLLKKGDRQNAQAWAENCLDIIDEGIEAAKVRVREFPDRAGPRKLAGGLFFRRAMLLKAFGEKNMAMGELKKAIATQESILGEIDAGNQHALAELERCKQYLAQWEAEAN